MKSFTCGAALALLAYGVFAWWEYLHRPPPKVIAPPIPVADRHEPIPTELEPGDGPLADLPDLSGVDRSLVVPPGLHDPRYCLLTFGRRQPKTRVWLVEDGDTLYADRDGSGTLTDPAKAFPAEKRRQIPGDAPSDYRTYWVGDVAPGGGSEKHTELKVIRYQSGDDEPTYLVYVRAFGKTLQYAAGKRLFCKDREAAPVVHFGGPVVAKSLRSDKLSADGSEQELHFCVGTPGRGKDSFAYVSIDAVPLTIRPVVKVRWPKGSPEAEDRFVLKERC
jgi:hypothetical protein